MPNIKFSGSRAASILLGMIGKNRRLGSESSNSADDELSSARSNLKARLLKLGQRKASSLTDDKRNDDEDKLVTDSAEDKERFEKAATILNGVFNKAQHQVKPTALQNQLNNTNDVCS